MLQRSPALTLQTYPSYHQKHDHPNHHLSPGSWHDHQHNHHHYQHKYTPYIQISVTSALATMALSPGKIPDPCSRARPSSSSLSFSIMTMMVMMMMMVVMRMMMDDHIIVYYEDDNYEDDDDDGEIGCLARLSCWPRMRFANSSVT